MPSLVLTIAILWVKAVANAAAVTPSDPCDPICYNITVNTVLKNDMMLTIVNELDINFQWLSQPMNYVNCSRRGLDRIPSSVPKSVQILDLSSNVISQIHKMDFEKFQELQVLWLYSNCMGNLPFSHFYCNVAGVFENDAFSLLLNLKVLNIGGNSLTSLPEKLPAKLEYLDISRSGIEQIKVSDLNYLKKLVVLNAKNLCYWGTCKYPFHIDNNTFQELPLKVLQLSENQNTFHLLSYLNPKSLNYVNFAQTHGDVLRAELMSNIVTVKRLELYLLNPNTKIRLEVRNHTFDKLVALEHLNLAGNMIDYLPANIFENNKNLTYLDLSGNCLYLTVIDPTYVPDQIKFLYLGYNYCIRDQNTDKSLPLTIRNNYSYHAFGPSFSRMQQLTVLSYAKPETLGTTLLQSIQIAFHDISNGTFYNLLHLKTTLLKLEIKDSFIQHVDLRIIECFQNMTSLDLFNNLIGAFDVSPQQLCSTEQIENNCSKELILTFSYNKIGMSLVGDILIHPKVTRLDLEFNLISSIHDQAFKKMPCLTYINLRNNPITFIHLKSFKSLVHLNTLYISSVSLIRDKNSLAFLKAFKNTLSLQLSCLDDNLFENLRKSHYHARAALDVDLSNNQIPSADHLKTGLKAFPNARCLCLKQCNIRFSKLVLPTRFLLHIDLSQNHIQQITTTFVRSVPQLKSLKIDRNEITQLDIDILDLLLHLETADFSYNHISQIYVNKTAKTYLKNLKVLKLQNNYIFELSIEIFSFSFLSKMDYLDLRWNSIECYCEMTKNFGRWLLQGSYKLSERPGFLLHCSVSLQRLGGCVTCAAAASQHNDAIEQSFIQFATKNLCSISFNIILTTSFTTFFLLFTSANVIFSSSKGMLWLAKFATQRVRSTRVDDERQTGTTRFAFHGFVMFDTEDQTTGNWVDEQLIPQLTHQPPYLNVAVIGRDDQCGIIPAVAQHLRSIEASRKVIMVMAGNYWQSCQGKYMISAIENLYYQTGYDRVVIVTFESDPHNGGLLQIRRKIAPMSVLQYPDDLRFCSIFWESLRHSLQ